MENADTEMVPGSPVAGSEGICLSRLGLSLNNRQVALRQPLRSNAAESPPNHPPAPPSLEKLSSTLLVPGAKNAGDHCFKVMGK